MKRGQIFKKKVVVVVVAAVVIVVAVVLLCLHGSDKTNTLVSSGGQIVLENVDGHMVAKNGTSITGTYKPTDNKEGVALYYVVTDTNKRKVLGAGSIQTGHNNRFSRNLAINTKDQIDKAGTLEVYAQDTSGKLLDSIQAPVTFE